MPADEMPHWTLAVCCDGDIYGPDCEGCPNASSVEVVPASALEALRAENERLAIRVEKLRAEIKDTVAEVREAEAERDRAQAAFDREVTISSERRVSADANAAISIELDGLLTEARAERDRYREEAKWRWSVMGEAKDALVCGDGSAAYNALTRHEAEGYPWASGAPSNRGPDAVPTPKAKEDDRG